MYLHTYTHRGMADCNIKGMAMGMLRITILCAFVCVCMYVCVHTCGHGGGWGGITTRFVLHPPECNS